MDAEARLRANGRLAESVPLGPLTTYKLGGPARFLVSIDDEGDLADAYRMAAARSLPIAALGRGSNVLVADSGFPGVVIRPGPGLNRLQVGETVWAGAGVPLPILARETARAGRGGLEFFTGIPGSVGGAIRMNAGCHGTETKEVLVTARVYDGVTGVASDLTAKDLDLSYRHSSLDDMAFVLAATFMTYERPASEAEAELRRITRWRREHQPGGTLNAGSVFKNPPGDVAGRLIDQAGLKGMRRGGVVVSGRHANFVEAGQDATAADVKHLVDDVIAAVEAATGVVLEPEVRFLGDFR